MTLEDVLKEAPCLVGIGNPARRDDGVGPWIAGRLRAAGVPCFDVEDVPENYVFELVRSGRPSVVFIDAAAAAAEPATVVFGPLRGAGESAAVSTHKLALGLCGRILEEAGRRVYLLGVVPRDLDFGPGLTDEVRRAAEAICDLVIETLKPGTEEVRHAG